MKFPLMSMLLVGLSMAFSSFEAKSAEPEVETRNLSLFKKAFEEIRSHGVAEVSPEVLVASALRGMMSSLDAHSKYVDEKRAKEAKSMMDGTSGKIGVEVRKDSGKFIIVSVQAGSPAEAAGILPGDEIKAVDGSRLSSGMAFGDVMALMGGEAGFTMSLSLARSGTDEMAISVLRRPDVAPSVSWRREGSVGYVHIPLFTKKTTEELLSAFSELSGSESFILDLRNNPGGLLRQAVSVSDAFLDSGRIVSTKGRSLLSHNEYEAVLGDLASGKPLVVMINEKSASSSEIVAAALRENGRAILVGADSFGKGTVQTITSLPDGSSIRLTTARYYTPSGGSIQGRGIAPDIKVSNPSSGSDTQLDMAKAIAAAAAKKLPRFEGTPVASAP